MKQRIIMGVRNASRIFKRNRDTIVKVQHKKKSLIRKVIIIALVIYLLGGLITGFLIFGRKNYSKVAQNLLRLYPLPSVMVNGDFGFASEVLQQMTYVEKFSAQTGQKIDSAETMRARAIDQEIENILVAQEAKRQAVSVTQKDVDEAFKKIIDENGGQDEVKKVLMTLYGMNPDEFKQLIRTQLLKDKFRENAFERVEVRHILLSDETKAKNLVKDINENRKSFEDGAKEFSKDDTSRESGGSLGKIARGTMPQLFDEAAFDKAEIGKTYGETIKTDFGYHIIRVDSKSGKIKASYQSWLDEAKKKAKIRKFLK